MKQAKLIVIAGLSAGVGKDTLINLFLDRHKDWHWPPSTTTRQPRAGEAHGKHMNFVDPEEFQKMRTADEFLETDFHAGNWYGTLRKPVEESLQNGRNVIVRVDVNGALAIKQKKPEAVLIFIDIEDEEQLENRIRGRGTETEEEIKLRLALAKEEQKFKQHFDHIIINKHERLPEALVEIEQAIETRS